MSPSNQTWRTTPPKACTPKVLRIISIPPRPTPIPYPQPPIEDKPFPPRRFNRFNSSANVPRRPDYFVSERHFYFQLLEEKMNSVPLPPLPPKIEYGETIPRPEWRPQTPPRTGRDEGIKLTRAYWLDRFGGLDWNWNDPKPITWYEFANTNVCWSERLEETPLGPERFWWKSHVGEYWRSSYFRPVVRPVWEWEYAFVGNGWRPDGGGGSR